MWFPAELRIRDLAIRHFGLQASLWVVVVLPLAGFLLSMRLPGERPRVQ